MNTQDIPAGYQLHITSWENDGDSHSTVIRSGLTKEDVDFKLDLLSSFGRQGGHGNTEADEDFIIETVEGAVSRHPNVSQSVKDHFAVMMEQDVVGEGCDEDDVKAEYAQGCCTLITNYLGYPQNDCYGRFFIRMFDSFEVYYFDSPVANVTQQF